MNLRDQQLNCVPFDQGFEFILTLATAGLASQPEIIAGNGNTMFATGRHW